MTREAQCEGMAFEVKAVTVWRSGDNKVMGYYPGIFGPNSWATYSYIMPAFFGFDGNAPDITELYPSAQMCMAAWENCQPITLAEPSAYNSALTARLRQRINEAGLFRDPMAVASLRNPFQEVAEVETT